MSIVSVKGVTKTYASGFHALRGVDLDIEPGEIVALLGPNGAGKTTLISTICGISQPTQGAIHVGGHNVVTDFRAARRLIGLVPQELNLEPFAKVEAAVAFSRGIFGLPRNPSRIEDILRQLSLWDKRTAAVKELSGGMKRRVLIAKALAHEPRVLFLDEPTAGVDVELRRDMWRIVAALKEQGVTIILTTHYIEEAEAIADRIAVINQGEILLIEDKTQLMSQMGKRNLRIDLAVPIAQIPDALAKYNLDLSSGGHRLTYTFEAASDKMALAHLVTDLVSAGLVLEDLQTQQSSLEDIFVDLVS